MLLIQLAVGGIVINVISVYAPQVTLDEDTKIIFWDQLDGMIQEIPVRNKVIIGGNFNGHVGKHRKNYEIVHGEYSFGDRNDVGESILDFSVAYDLIVTNTLFKKREEHLIVFKSGSSKSQVDYFLMWRADLVPRNMQGL